MIRDRYGKEIQIGDFIACYNHSGISEYKVLKILHSYVTVESTKNFYKFNFRIAKVKDSILLDVNQVKNFLPKYLPLKAYNDYLIETRLSKKKTNVLQKILVRMEKR